MSVAAAAIATALLALTPPFRGEDADVRAGNAALAAGDAETALRRYARAGAALGERPELLYDRGTAALRAGRLGEAARLLERAAERAEPGLASRALQNLGNARASAGDAEGAATALRAALRKDPANEDARYDLEVLLRRAGRGGRTPTVTAQVNAPSPPADAGERERSSSSAPANEAVHPERGADAPAAALSRGTPRQDRPRDRQDAEALLDALRARERTLPAFGAGRQRARRADAAKDW